MAVNTFWPVRRSRRLDEGMADERARAFAIQLTSRPTGWNPERLAAVLVSQRDQLVQQLPQELAIARGLSRDQLELVVDESIDYLVTEYGKPIVDWEHVQRAFFAAASIRVRRMRDGRGATVRAGWQRVDVEGLEIAASEPDPASVAVERLERSVLLEFAGTLTDTQRRVLAAKYGDGPRELGRVVVARRLGMPVSEVRKAERAITKQLDRFVAIMSAGTLCEHRGGAITAYAGGNADAQQEVAARLHLRYCPTCRVGYVEHVRALRSGAIQRRIAELLPPLPAIEEGRRHRNGPWDVVSDWMSRLLGSEATPAGLQLAAGARGLGTIAAAKLATVCIGGVLVVGGGGYCVTTLLKPSPSPPPVKRDSPERPTTTFSGRTDEKPPRIEIMKAARATAVPARRKSAPRPADKGPAATRHEREATVSPPVVQSSGAAIPEFGPAPANTGPPAPAAPPSSGGPEFP